MSRIEGKPLAKGYHMEELLRMYFLRSGYFVVRGVPFIYEGFDVTDIDLWLYNRTSSVSREITLVDSKNKKTPQAIERIFWVHGLLLAVKATNSIVATTDKRQEVKNFGKQLGVVVLDGNFLQRLATAEQDLSRISDEEFFGKVNEYALNKLDGDWKGRLRHCKGLLASSLSFDSCNEWMLHGKFFAEQCITRKNQRELALRSLYLVCSFISIGLDFVMKEISFTDTAERIKTIKEGFTYGSRGSDGIKNIVNVASGLIEENVKDGSSIAHQVRMNVNQKFSALNTGVLGEYFSKNEVAKSLFNTAKEFEQLAMNRDFNSHGSSSSELKSFLYCMLDFWNIDRLQFSERRTN